MSVMLDSLCGPARLADCAYHDAGLHAELQAMADKIKARINAQTDAAPRFAPAVDAAPAPSMETYRRALGEHDWFFGYSDDYGAYCRGRDSLSRLTAIQRAIDPEHAVWNEHAPSEFRVGAVA